MLAVGFFSNLHFDNGVSGVTGRELQRRLDVAVRYTSITGSFRPSLHFGDGVSWAENRHLSADFGFIHFSTFPLAWKTIHFEHGVVTNDSEIVTDCCWQLHFDTGVCNRLLSVVHELLNLCIFVCAMVLRWSVSSAIAESRESSASRSRIGWGLSEKENSMCIP